MSSSFDYHRAVEKVLARSPDLARVLAQRADDVADVARKLGPRGRTGRYVEGIDADVGMGDKGLVGRVNANHFTSHWVEFGTVRMRPFAPLRRALETVMGTRNIRGGSRA